MFYIRYTIYYLIFNFNRPFPPKLQIFEIIIWEIQIETMYLIRTNQPNLISNIVAFIILLHHFHYFHKGISLLANRSFINRPYIFYQLKKHLVFIILVKLILANRLLLRNRNGQTLLLLQGAKRPNQRRTKELRHPLIFRLYRSVQMLANYHWLEWHEVVARTIKQGMLSLALITWNCLVLSQFVVILVTEIAVIFVIFLVIT